MESCNKSCKSVSL